MNTATIERRIARGIELKRLIADYDKELKEIKADLITEAESRPEEHEPTEGGGWSWRHQDAQGNVACITQPAPKLRSKVDPESPLYAKVKAMAGRSWSLLFAQVPSYEPVAKFRELAAQHCGPNANKLIKLMSGPSTAQVNFEVAETKESA